MLCGIYHVESARKHRNRRASVVNASLVRDSVHASCKTRGNTKPCSCKFSRKLFCDFCAVSRRTACAYDGYNTRFQSLDVAFCKQHNRLVVNVGQRLWILVVKKSYPMDISLLHFVQTVVDSFEFCVEVFCVVAEYLLYDTSRKRFFEFARLVELFEQSVLFLDREFFYKAQRNENLCVFVESVHQLYFLSRPLY